jgi:hypothetical protein
LLLQNIAFLMNVRVVFMGGTFIGWLSGIDGCRQLLRLTRKGADPFKFKFVEHHKTPLFTFHSHGKRSVWIVDGELFPAHTVSGQVFRGLVNLFACGPEI